MIYCEMNACVDIHTVICSMRTALVASVSCRRLFMCSILRVAVLSFWLSSSLVGSTVHTNGSRDQTKDTHKLKVTVGESHRHRSC